MMGLCKFPEVLEGNVGYKYEEWNGTEAHIDNNNYCPVPMNSKSGDLFP